MRSSSVSKRRRAADFVQMPLDFLQENQYIITPLEGDVAMSMDIFEQLDNKINELLARHEALKEENRMLVEENSRLQQEREGLKGRVDAILAKLEGV